MIIIHPYKAGWKADFAAIREHLLGILDSEAPEIAHIGSTAVAGMGAKDVIDIQVGIADLRGETGSRLQSAGYEYLAGFHCDHVPAGESGSTDGWNKLFFRQRPGQRPCHIHVRRLGNPNHRYALLFRDSLRAHGGARLSLERIKQALALLHGNDTDAYYAVKDPACDLIWHAANEWALTSGWRVDVAGLY